MSTPPGDSTPGVSEVNIAQQVPPPETLYTDELDLLARQEGPKLPGWRLTPSTIVSFICGNPRLKTNRKFVGDTSLIERCAITLAGERALLLVGGFGTVKPILSELLSVVICGISMLTVQGNTGMTEGQLRYGWDYVQLLTRGPSVDILVPSPVLAAMSSGRAAHTGEIIRCLPEVQDSLVSILSERRTVIPELGEHTIHTRPGFCLIATASLRDQGVLETSVALKRRFSSEAVAPICDAPAEIVLVTEKTKQALSAAGVPVKVDEVIVETLITAFHDLRSGVSQEGWAVEKLLTVLSTAEVVAISGSIALARAFFLHARDGVRLTSGQLLGVVRKDDSEDGARLLAYWDSTVKRRANEGRHTWAQLWELHSVFED